MFHFELRAMAEIVLAEPSYEVDTEYRPPLTRAITISSAHDLLHEPFESERLPPSLASEIQEFLRIANLVGGEEPRIAYLCKLGLFY
jgi:callose synthase